VKFRKKTAEALDARQRLREELLQGAEPGDYRWLAGELLEYHRREARPGWWWYFRTMWNRHPMNFSKTRNLLVAWNQKKTHLRYNKKRSLISYAQIPATGP